MKLTLKQILSLMIPLAFSFGVPALARCESCVDGASPAQPAHAPELADQS